MDLRLPRGMVWPTNDVEEAATRFDLSVLEDGRVEPLHWRNLLEEARCNGKLLDMQSSLVDGLTCNLSSEIVHEPVLLECGCSMLICGKHAPMLDRCPHCRSPQQFQGGRAAKPNRQLQAVLDSITFMCPRCGRTGIYWINQVCESSVVLRFANLVSPRMDTLEHVATHAHDDRSAVLEKVLEICCRTASLAMVHCLVNLELANTALEMENASLKEELRSLQEIAREHPDDDCCDVDAECCDAPTVQQLTVDGQKATTPA